MKGDAPTFLEVIVNVVIVGAIGFTTSSTLTCADVYTPNANCKTNILHVPAPIILSISPSDIVAIKGLSLIKLKSPLLFVVTRGISAIGLSPKFLFIGDIDNIVVTGSGIKL